MTFAVATTHQLFGPQVDPMSEQTGPEMDAVVDLMIDVFLRGVDTGPG